MQRARSTRGGGGGRSGQPDTPGVTGNLETGLFTAGGRDRFSGGNGGAGGPTRSSRTSRRGTHRGAASLPPRPHASEDVDGDMKMGGEKISSLLVLDSMFYESGQETNYCRHKEFIQIFAVLSSTSTLSNPYQRPGRSTRSSTASQIQREGTIIVFVRSQRLPSAWCEINIC